MGKLCAKPTTFTQVARAGLSFAEPENGRLTITLQPGVRRCLSKLVKRDGSILPDDSLRPSKGFAAEPYTMNRMPTPDLKVATSKLSR